MKALHIAILVGFFAILVAATLHLPRRAELNAPLHAERSVAGSATAGTHYIRNAYADAETVNIVTVVLADYRGFDTLGETIVVFAAGVACMLILGRRRGS